MKRRSPGAGGSLRLGDIPACPKTGEYGELLGLTTELWWPVVTALRHRAVPGLSALISRRFGWSGVVRVRGADRAGAGWRWGARGDRGPAFGPGHFLQGEGFQFGGQFPEPAAAGEPGCVGVVLGLGEGPGDGLAPDGAGPLDVGAVQGGRVGLAGAAGLAAAGAADGNAAGQGMADLAEGGLDGGPGPGCAVVVCCWHGVRAARIAHRGRDGRAGGRRVAVTWWTVSVYAAGYPVGPGGRR